MKYIVTYGKSENATFGTLQIENLEVLYEFTKFGKPGYFQQDFSIKFLNAV